MRKMPDTSCRLCGAERVQPFYSDARREYLQCTRCMLVFVPERFLLSAADEKAHYDRHENHPHDLEYRRFLSRLADPLMQNLSPGAIGLDFGSGPGPTLSRMLAEAGFPMSIYDPFYAPDDSVWQRSYDFVTSSEVVEHLHRPRYELERLWAVLRPGGVLGIMTKRLIDRDAFENWHYKNDPTHVLFFSEPTFAWLSGHWSASLQVVGPDVVLLRKGSASTTGTSGLAGERQASGGTTSGWKTHLGID